MLGHEYDRAGVIDWHLREGVEAVLLNKLPKGFWQTWFEWGALFCITVGGVFGFP